MTQSQRALLAVADMTQGEYLTYLEDEYMMLLKSSNPYQAMDSLIELSSFIARIEDITPKQFNHYRKLYLQENPYTQIEVIASPLPIAEESTEVQLSLF